MKAVRFRECKVPLPKSLGSELLPAAGLIQALFMLNIVPGPNKNIGANMLSCRYHSVCKMLVDGFM